MNPLIRDTVKVCIAYLVLIQPQNSFYFIGHTKKNHGSPGKSQTTSFCASSTRLLELDCEMANR